MFNPNPKCRMGEAQRTHQAEVRGVRYRFTHPTWPICGDRADV
jgi:hypothetical protein